MAVARIGKRFVKMDTPIVGQFNMPLSGMPEVEPLSRGKASDQAEFVW